MKPDWYIRESANTDRFYISIDYKISSFSIHRCLESPQEIKSLVKKLQTNLSEVCNIVSEFLKKYTFVSEENVDVYWTNIGYFSVDHSKSIVCWWNSQNQYKLENNRGYMSKHYMSVHNDKKVYVKCMLGYSCLCKTEDKYYKPLGHGKTSVEKYLPEIDETGQCYRLVRTRCDNYTYEVERISFTNAGEYLKIETTFFRPWTPTDSFYSFLRDIIISEVQYSIM